MNGRREADIMTKITANRIKSLLDSGAEGFAAVLLFGPDRGLAREYRNALVAAVVDDPGDPFRVAELAAKQIKNEPARFWDEVMAQSLMGGRRTVIVRDCADGVTATLKPFLAEPAGDALVVLEAGELAPRSSLRKAFESAKTAAAVGCYPDDGRNLIAVIRETLTDHGLKPTSAAETYLAERLGNDRQVTRMELEKLALYCQGQSDVSLDDAESSVGDASLSTLDAVVDSALTGRVVALERGLDRAFEEGNNAIALLRILFRRLDRLELVRAQVDQGQNLDAAIKALRPPVNFKRVDTFRAQIRIWSRSMLARGREIALEAEIAGKSSGGLPETMVSRAFLRLAQAARRDRQRKPRQKDFS